MTIILVISLIYSSTKNRRVEDPPAADILGLIDFKIRSWLVQPNDFLSIQINNFFSILSVS